MWRLLIVAMIALIPAALSYVAQETGYHVTWLPRPERPSFLVGPTPPPGWQERAYLAANPDVAAAVRDGFFASGYDHYQAAGQREGRGGGFPPNTVAEIPTR